MQLHGNSINGYKENASIRRDICIMSVYGTAVHEMPSFPNPCSCVYIYMYILLLYIVSCCSRFSQYFSLRINEFK